MSNLRRRPTHIATAPCRKRDHVERRPHAGHISERLTEAGPLKFTPGVIETEQFLAQANATTRGD